MTLKIEPFSCKRQDLTIRGHVFREKEGILPAVVLSHGFMASQNETADYAKLLASLGYAAFTFDFCGGSPISTSDGKSEDMTVFTEVEDLEAVIAYVKTLPYVNTKDISILGCSQGGFVSAIVAKNNPDLKKLLLIYPALCIPDDMRAGHLQVVQFDPDNIPDLIMTEPMKVGRNYVNAVNDLDYKEAIKGFNGRTVLIHGDKDTIVDPSYSKNAKELYPDSAYYEIKGGAHGFSGSSLDKALEIIATEMKR
jgi:hypothetical protein